MSDTPLWLQISVPAFTLVGGFVLGRVTKVLDRRQERRDEQANQRSEFELTRLTGSGYRLQNVGDAAATDIRVDSGKYPRERLMRLPAEPFDLAQDQPVDFIMPTERLGVSVSSIYHHLSGRAVIIEALRERLVAAIEPPPLDGSNWGEQISRWMRNYRRALAEHPNLMPLLNAQTMTGGSVLLGYERVATLLRLAGVPVGEVVLWLGVLDAYALGSALDLTAPDDVWRFERDDLPVLAEAIKAAPVGRKRADGAFELGLEALVASLRRRLFAE